MVNKSLTSISSRLPIIFLLLGAISLFLWATATDWLPAITANDLSQTRLDMALPLPRGLQANRQTFIPNHDGLAAAEIILVKYGEEEAIGESGEFRLTLLDDRERVVVYKRYEISHLTHNQTLSLTFPPQANSAGKTYTLVMSGDDNNQVTAWGYSLDVMAGELQNAGISEAQELRLVTNYQLQIKKGLRDLGRILWAEAGVLQLALAFILLPGVLLWPLFPNQWPSTVKLGIAWALGLSIWPLLWYWTSLLGWRWQGWMLWTIFGAGWGLVLWRLEIGDWKLNFHHSPFTIHHLPLFLLLFLTLALRFLAVRDLAFPPWVDASRHALITAVTAEQGQFLSDYRPYLPADAGKYHYGFHTISASLLLMTKWPLARLLLYLGQLLSGAIPLTIYAAAWLISRSRRAALLAAFLVGIPFFFPAYYTTWGRFTQLSAILILPILLALTWNLVSNRSVTLSPNHPCFPAPPLSFTPSPKRPNVAHPLTLSLLSAGIFLLHFRVFLLYLPFVLLVWLVTVGRGSRQLVGAAGLSGLLIAPRIWQLWQLGRKTSFSLSAAPTSYGEFPIGYVTTGWEREFLILGGAALLISLWGVLRRRQWGVLPLILALWSALVWLLLSGRIPGMPAVWLINLNSAYIVAFVPLALILGVVGARVWHWLTILHWSSAIFFNLVMGGALAAALLFGARQQITILNNSTILAMPADMAGIEFVREEMPASARIAINAWQWLGNTWTGSDGGAWINSLTAHQVTTPPVDHIYNKNLFAQVRDFNENAGNIDDWRTLEAADWLRDQGVTHVFVGARGGEFDPAQLAQNPRMKMLYGQDGVFVFEIME